MRFKNYTLSLIALLSLSTSAQAKQWTLKECIEYALSYMKILNSLKVGGKWHYVPSVTFIEELLPEDKFEVKNSFINDNIMRTVVKRIK